MIPNFVVFLFSPANCYRTLNTIEGIVKFVNIFGFNFLNLLNVFSINHDDVQLLLPSLDYCPIILHYTQSIAILKHTKIKTLDS